MGNLFNKPIDVGEILEQVFYAKLVPERAKKLIRLQTASELVTELVTLQLAVTFGVTTDEAISERLDELQQEINIIKEYIEATDIDLVSGGSANDDPAKASSETLKEGGANEK